MTNYPEWDDFCQGAWKSFEEKVFSKAASLEPVRSDITYSRSLKQWRTIGSSGSTVP